MPRSIRSPLILFIGLLFAGGMALPISGLAAPTGSAWPQVDSQTADTSSVSVTHGPIVGGVTSESAVIFLRTSAEADVRIVASTSPDFSPPRVFSSMTTALAENDSTVHTQLTDLEPGTTYYYTALVGLRPAILPGPPRFQTAPEGEAPLDFSFGVLSDLSRRNLGAQAYAQLDADQPAFVLQIGDFDHGDPARLEPNTVDDWRAMSRRVLRDSRAGLAFARYIGPGYAFYHIWDDHDYGFNNADRTAPWKGLATQAFREYYPMPPLPNPAGGNWYSFRYAQAEVFMLDLRSQRDPNDEPDSAEKSMLDGAELTNGQKQWLMDGLLNSTARWKFIVSSSVWNPNSKQTDSWFQFAFEQAELVQFIRDNGITGVVILSGDLHSGGAIDDGSNSFFPELSVPTTNIRGQRECTGDLCGTWSEGIITGIDPSGYGWVRIEHDPASGRDRAILQAKGEDGTVRLEYIAELP